MSKLINTKFLKDNNYKLVGYNNETTDNKIILLNDSDKQHYKDLIKLNEDNIKSNGLTKCYICNTKLTKQYFLCSGTDIKVIGGTNCLTNFGNTKMTCCGCCEDSLVSIKSFDINYFKEHIEGYYLCDKCKSYKYITTKKEFNKININYYKDWVFKNITELIGLEYSLCNNCSLIYKPNTIYDCGYCKYCKSNKEISNDKKCGMLNFVYQRNTYSFYKNHTNTKTYKYYLEKSCWCDNCCFKDTDRNFLLKLDTNKNREITEIIVLQLHTLFSVEYFNTDNNDINQYKKHNDKVNKYYNGVIKIFNSDFDNLKNELIKLITDINHIDIVRNIQQPIKIVKLTKCIKDMFYVKMRYINYNHKVLDLHIYKDMFGNEGAVSDMINDSGVDKCYCESCFDMKNFGEKYRTKLNNTIKTIVSCNSGKIIEILKDTDISGGYVMGNKSKQIINIRIKKLKEMEDLVVSGMGYINDKLLFTDIDKNNLIIYK